MRKIKKIILYLLVLLFVTLAGAFGNFKINEQVEKEKNSIEQLKTEYDKYLSDYLKLNEYVELKNEYDKQTSEIISQLNEKNILIYNE